MTVSLASTNRGILVETSQNTYFTYAFYAFDLSVQTTEAIEICRFSKGGKFRSDCSHVTCEASEIYRGMSQPAGCIESSVYLKV